MESMVRTVKELFEDEARVHVQLKTPVTRQQHKDRARQFLPEEWKRE